MIFVDDREDGNTYDAIVLATDTYMSGWGEAKDGPSYAGWACTEEDLDECLSWVRGRPEMKRVRVVAPDYRPPSGGGHCHIYIYHGQARL